MGEKKFAILCSKNCLPIFVLFLAPSKHTEPSVKTEIKDEMETADNTRPDDPRPDQSVSKPNFSKTKPERRAEDLLKRLMNRDNLVPAQQEWLDKQLKKDGRNPDGSLFTFNDLLKGHKDKDQPIIGRSLDFYHTTKWEGHRFGIVSPSSYQSIGTIYCVRTGLKSTLV